MVLKKPKGRPTVHENVVDLIIEMKRCNWLWGAQRISDELKILGISVSKKTILKFLKESGYVHSVFQNCSPASVNNLNFFCILLS